jgi:hypothetical protein
MAALVSYTTRWDTILFLIVQQSYVRCEPSVHPPPEFRLHHGLPSA